MLRTVGEDAVLAIRAKQNVNLGMIFIVAAGPAEQIADALAA